MTAYSSVDGDRFIADKELYSLRRAAIAALPYSIAISAAIVDRCEELGLQWHCNVWRVYLEELLEYEKHGAST